MMGHPIVLPYRDQDGTIRYLISRKTGQSDDVPGKYLKLANTKPWVADDVVFEPIYGCDTVEPGEDLVLTTGEYSTRYHPNVSTISASW